MSLRTAGVSIYLQILPYLLYAVDFWISARLCSSFRSVVAAATPVPGSYDLFQMNKHSTFSSTTHNYAQTYIKTCTNAAARELYYRITCFIMCVRRHIINKQRTLNPGALMQVLVGMVLYAPHFRSWIMSTCTPSPTIAQYLIIYVVSLYCFSFSLTKLPSLMGICIDICFCTVLWAFRVRVKVQTYCYCLLNHCFWRNSYLRVCVFMHALLRPALCGLQSEPEDCNPEIDK